MSDLIDREALLKRMNRRLDILRKECGPFDHFTDGYDEAVDHVMDFPAVEAELVRHGKWIRDDLGRTCCSVCEKLIPYVEEYDTDEECGGTYEVEIDETPYCPNCGAKMDGGAEDS